MTINKELLPVKAHFFFGLAGAAPIYPFLPLMIKELGFSATVLGTINFLAPILAMVAKPMAGAIADRYKIYKPLLVILILVNTGIVLLFKLVPPLPMDRSVALMCGAESSDILISTGRAKDPCFLRTLASAINSSKADCEFIPREWQGGFINELSRNGKSFNGSSSTHEAILVTLGFPHQKDEDTIAVHVDTLTKSYHNWREPVCINSSELTGDLHCPIPILHETVTKIEIQDSEVINYKQFWILLFVILGMRVIVSCAENLADSICFKLLKGNPHKYGLQRMWGAAGWGLMSFITGALVDKMSEGKATVDRSIAFYLSAGIAVIDALICLKLKVKDVRTKKKNHIWSDVKGLLLTNPKFIVFLVLVIGCGVFSSMVWNFLFWLIEEIAKEGGCSNKSKMQTLNGLVLAVNCFLGEMPFLFLSGWFLKKIGYEHCLSLVLVAFGVRFISYYFLSNPWWILPIEVLNGVTFGLFYATMTTYANALTPPGLEGTMQGLVSAAFEGVGVAFGSLIGGHLFDSVGGRNLFLFGGAASLFLAAVHSLFLLCWADLESASTSQIEEDTSDYPAHGLRIPPEQNSAEEELKWN